MCFKCTPRTHILIYMLIYTHGHMCGKIMLISGQIMNTRWDLNREKIVFTGGL